MTRTGRSGRVWGIAGVLVAALLIPTASGLVDRDGTYPRETLGITDAGPADRPAIGSAADAMRAGTGGPPSPTTAGGVSVTPMTASTARRTAVPPRSSKAPVAAPVRTKAALAPAASNRASRITGDRSGLDWASGVYIPGSNPRNAAAFGNWRGAPVDVVVDWPARANWNDVVNPGWLYEAWEGTPYTKVFGVAPVPEGDASATMAGCAAGRYNDKWRQFGERIQASGLADETVIRLGWEFNGDWYKWSARDPEQFARCWRQIVGTVRRVAPQLLWDWSVNRGRGAGVADARRAYPGDGYVDIVGVDSYDIWPGVTSAATWRQHYAGAYGLKFWADFAARHGKKLSVPEWGVYPGTAHEGHNGGDNPLYIARMRAFFAEQGSRLAYESYFNESDGYYAGSLFGPNLVPAASARYRALFRP